MKDSTVKLVGAVLGVILVVSLISSSMFSSMAMMLAINSKPKVKIVTGSGSAQGSPVAPNGSATPNAPATPETPATPDAPETPEAPATPADKGEAKPSKDGVPASGKAAFDFYKKACDRVKKNGEATFIKKNWQEIGNITVTEGKVPGKLIENIKSFATGEDEAEAITYQKGTAEAKEEMCGADCDFSKVKSATATADGNNIKIVMELKEEAKVVKKSNGIASVATGILYMEDVRNTVENNKLLSIFVKDFDQSSDIIYKSYVMTATITKDGKLIDINQVAKADVIVAATLIGNMRVAGNGDFTMHSHIYGFAY